FWATDEHILHRDDGSAWVKIGTLDLADMTERDYGSLQSRTHGNVDHTTGVAPANVTKAAAVEGTDAAVARADHKHDVSTATAGSSAMGDGAAECTATSLARSDHLHGRESFGTPGSSALGDTASAGVATTVARSDQR